MKNPLKTNDASWALFWQCLVFFTGPLPEEPSANAHQASEITTQEMSPHPKNPYSQASFRFISLALSAALSFAFADKNKATIKAQTDIWNDASPLFSLFFGRMDILAFLASFSANILINGRTIQVPFKEIMQALLEGKKPTLGQTGLAVLHLFGLFLAIPMSLVFARPLVDEGELSIGFIYVCLIARWFQIAYGLPSSINSFKTTAKHLNASNGSEKTVLWGLFLLAIVAAVFIGYSNTKFPPLKNSNSSYNFIHEACYEIGSLPDWAVLLIRTFLGGGMYALTFANIIYANCILAKREAASCFKEAQGVALLAFLLAMISAFSNIADLNASNANGTQTNSSNTTDLFALPIEATASIEFVFTAIINVGSMLRVSFLFVMLIEQLIKVISLSCHANHTGQTQAADLQEQLIDVTAPRIENPPETSDEVDNSPKASHPLGPNHLSPAFILALLVWLSWNPGLTSLLVPLFVLSPLCPPRKHSKAITPAAIEAHLTLMNRAAADTPNEPTPNTTSKHL
jgi:hypothetical protein